MNLLVTGAGGFLGQAMVDEAVRAGHTVRAWTRSTPVHASTEYRQADEVRGDLRDAGVQRMAVQGMDALIHCAAVTSAGRTDVELSRNVNVEALKQIHAAFKHAGGARWIQISSMSAHPGSTSVYGSTKLAGDEFLRASSPPPAWTILRPSLIYGPGEQGLVAKTIKLLEKLPVLPLLGSGRELIRPIFVNDVARVALACLAKPQTEGRTYMLGGADEIELRQFMRRLAGRRGLKRTLFPLPLPLAMLLARGLGMVSATPPISVDNVLGVREALRVDVADATRDLQLTLLGVEDGLNLTFAS